MRKILVSIIITTKNEEQDIQRLLVSIEKQTYKTTETIVIDNNSSDKTCEIAQKYTNLVFNKGPERSVQRNFGSQKSRGNYVLFLDADMELSPTVISECVNYMETHSVGGIIIPEASVGKGFWTKVKAYERSFYVGDDTIEAARCFKKQVFHAVGGFDETINGPEDWDLSDRISKKYGLGRIKSIIKHHEGYLTLKTLMRKKYYYGRKTNRYMNKNSISIFSPKTLFFLRKSFYLQPGRIITHPILFVGMIVMLTLELIAGAMGYLRS